MAGFVPDDMMNTLSKDFFFFLWYVSKSVLEKIFTLFEEIFTSFIYFKDMTEEMQMLLLLQTRSFPSA